MKIARLKRTVSLGIAGILLAALPFVVLAQPKVPVTTTPSSDRIIMINSELRQVPQADWKQIKSDARGNDAKLAAAVRSKNYSLAQNPRISTLDGISASLTIDKYRETITPKINKNDTITLDTDISYALNSNVHANRTVHNGQEIVLSDAPTDSNAFVNVTIITPTITSSTSSTTAP